MQNATIFFFFFFSGFAAAAPFLSADSHSLYVAGHANVHRHGAAMCPVGSSSCARFPLR